MNRIFCAYGAIIAFGISHDDHCIADHGNRMHIACLPHDLVVMDDCLGGLVNRHVTVINSHIGDTISKRDVVDGLAGIS